MAHQHLDLAARNIKHKVQVENIRNVIIIIAMRTIAVVVNVLQTQSALVYPTLLL